MCDGLVGYYMKSDIFPTNLTQPMSLNDASTVHLNTLMIENKINEVFTEDETIWNGLTSKFFHEFGSHYGEYISIPETKYYKFKMSCKDACWMKIDGNIILSIIGDSKEKYRSVTDSVYLENGIHTFDLDYLHYIGGKGLEIFIWNDNDEIWEYPTSFLKYIKLSNFIYTSVQNVYIKDEAITTNKPILFDIDEKDISYYSIARELPNGLEFNNMTGEIYGKASESSYELYYQICCYLSNSSSYETEISIKVDNISVASGIYLIDLDTTTIYYNEINMTIGYPVSFGIDSSGPKVEKYEVTKICNGLVYNKKDLTIKGNVMNDENCEISIIATNEAGKTTKIFKPKLFQSCESDNEHLGYFELFNCDYSTTVMILDKNNNILYNETGLSSKWNKMICLVEDKYKIIINKNNTNKYTVLVKCDGGVIVNKEIEKMFGYSLDLEMNTYSPEVIYPKEVNVEQYECISIKPEILHPSSIKFEVFSNLENLNINSDTGEIYGYILSNPIVSETTVVVENGFGRILNDITFNIRENSILLFLSFLLNSM